MISIWTCGWSDTLSCSKRWRNRIHFIIWVKFQTGKLVQRWWWGHKICNRIHDNAWLQVTPVTSSVISEMPYPEDLSPLTIPPDMSTAQLQQGIGPHCKACRPKKKRGWMGGSITGNSSTTLPFGCINSYWSPAEVLPNPTRNLRNTLCVCHSFQFHCIKDIRSRSKPTFGAAWGINRGLFLFLQKDVLFRIYQFWELF